MSHDHDEYGRGVVLRDHHLAHLPALRVTEQLLSSRFSGTCSMDSCSARCCRDGVLVDVEHRDRILAEAPLILEYMETVQEHDPSRWFYEELEPDADFPSGFAANTTAESGSCVFLDSQRRCVLQRAEEKSPGLKPFFCRAYPIAIVNARVTVDADWCPDESHCCGTVPDGELTVFDVCSYELAFLLGEAGAREVREIADQLRSSGAVRPAGESTAG